MKYFDFKKAPSKIGLITLLFSVALGLLIMLLFSGKSYNMQLNAIAVSPNEQHIACFETGNGYKIRCFHADGSSAFVFEIPSDISSGGHCTLWFEEDVLCALFYRTDRIVHFALDGEILDISDNTAEMSPPEFPSFSKDGHHLVFNGNEIEVVYNSGSFFGYWFLDAERDLKITFKDGESKVVWRVTAAEGIIQEED